MKGKKQGKERKGKEHERKKIGEREKEHEGKKFLERKSEII